MADCRVENKTLGEVGAESAGHTATKPIIDRGLRLTAAKPVDAQADIPALQCSVGEGVFVPDVRGVLGVVDQTRALHAGVEVNRGLVEIGRKRLLRGEPHVAPPRFVFGAVRLVHKTEAADDLLLLVGVGESGGIVPVWSYEETYVDAGGLVGIVHVRVAVL